MVVKLRVVREWGCAEKAPFDGQNKFQRNRNPSDHVLVDQSLKLQFLPLGQREITYPCNRKEKRGRDRPRTLGS